jgi:hypothetical protein
MPMFLWVIWAILAVAITAVLIALLTAKDDYEESEKQDE